MSWSRNQGQFKLQLVLLQQSSLLWGSVCCWWIDLHITSPWSATGHCVIRMLILFHFAVESILEIHFWPKCPFGSQPGIFSLDFISVSALLFHLHILCYLPFLEFADVWSGVWIPTCCAVPACRVWPVPSHAGRCPAHSWQHYCQRWVWQWASSVTTNNINNDIIDIWIYVLLQTQGIVRRCLVSPVTACWKPWLEWRLVAVWLR